MSILSLLAAGCRRPVVVAAAAAGLFAVAGSAAIAAATYDPSGPRPIETALPSATISSPNYRLAPTVQTFGYLNNFVLGSEFGTFEAPSNTMLRRLIREIEAIRALKEITLTEAYADALAKAALSPVRGVTNLVTDPVGTVKAVPTAIFDVFSRVGQGIESAVSGETTEYEDSAVAQSLQMSSYKRDYAKQLGVDPYSSNPVLQQELESVAWAAAVGNLTISAATMASGSAVVAGLSYARNISQAVEIVAAEPPSELMLRNRAALEAMAIDPALADQFLAQQQYSPRAKTILIMALAGMQKTAGRDALLQAALAAPDEVTAIMYQQTAELLNAFDERIAPIARLERFNRVVVAHLANGSAVLLLPIDYVSWNEQSAAAAAQLVTQLKLKAGSREMGLWITGVATPLFKKQAAALGIRVEENVGAHLPLLD